MKKDRNSFFQSSNFNMSTAQNITPMNYGMPQMMGNMYNPNMPNMMEMKEQFYQANIPYNNPMPSNMSEIEARMAKLERSLNRLEARINKLEGTTYYSKDNYEVDGNMYMV